MWAAPLLLAAIVILGPVDGAELVDADPTRVIRTLKWKPVVEATAYRVALDFNPRFERPLHETKTTQTSLHLTGLDIGHYHWRVVAVGRDGEELAVTKPASFKVTLPPRP